MVWNKSFFIFSMSARRAKGSNFGVSINRSCKGELQNKTLFVFLRAILTDITTELFVRCKNTDTPFTQLVMMSITTGELDSEDAKVCRKVLKYSTALSVYEGNQRKKTRHVSVQDFASVVVACARRMMYHSMENVEEIVDVSPLVVPELVDKWGGALGHGYPPLIKKILKLYESFFDNTDHFLSCVTLSSKGFIVE